MYIYIVLSVCWFLNFYPLAFRALSVHTSDRLDCAANAKINLKCIFAASGGVHALT